MAMPTACRCGCVDASGIDAHRIMAALADDDLDGAVAAGLLDVADCPGCTPECHALLSDARDARRSALAARERFRAREARLARRQRERLARRDATASAGTETQVASRLPPAAAAALERALARARAAGRDRR